MSNNTKHWHVTVAVTGTNMLKSSDCEIKIRDIMQYIMFKINSHALEPEEHDSKQIDAHGVVLHSALALDCSYQSGLEHAA